mmetsp:Transcript_28376/g.28674  ORF Transcript_28376/g.28674 Transcript_28376/m.28674 type:complete len:114 (+) Transcript_28376:234-575(+)
MSSSKNSQSNALRDLDCAEKDLLVLMQKAQETCAELEKVPNCNMKRIEELSSEYIELTETIRSRIRKHIGFLVPYAAYGQGNYTLRSEVDVAKACSQLLEMNDGEEDNLNINI